MNKFEIRHLDMPDLEGISELPRTIQTLSSNLAQKIFQLLQRKLHFKSKVGIRLLQPQE